MASGSALTPGRHAPENAKTNQNIKFYSFTTSVKRNGRSGPFKEGFIILKSQPDRVTLLRIPQNFPELKTGFKLATNVRITPDGTVNFMPNTKILSTHSFDFDHTVVEQFHNPPMTSIRDALMSPLNSRVSIEGKIIQAYPRTTSGVRRRTLHVQQNTEQATVKLWAEKSSLEIPLHRVVKITHLQVNEYHGVKDLNSTSRTAIEIIPQEVTRISGTIEAAGFEEHEQMIILKDNLYHCSQNILNEAFPDGVLTTQMFEIAIENDVVMSMTPLDEKVNPEGIESCVNMDLSS